jgi:hypothetical protein
VELLVTGACAGLKAQTAAMSALGGKRTFRGKSICNNRSPALTVVQCPNRSGRSSLLADTWLLSSEDGCDRLLPGLRVGRQSSEAE